MNNGRMSLKKMFNHMRPSLHWNLLYKEERLCADGNKCIQTRIINHFPKKTVEKQTRKKAYLLGVFVYFTPAHIFSCFYNLSDCHELCLLGI